MDGMVLARRYVLHFIILLVMQQWSRFTLHNHVFNETFMSQGLQGKDHYSLILVGLLPNGLHFLVFLVGLLTKGFFLALP